ncbi:hypothetical protein TSTA_110190 [Talaromyces stipitatus ATCC 10500]|uniref:Nephrocystin 3-like N-terminal domain-containing protein n=1 Tax=Talaromyces stipitatus (strain ATCC 10500 / CBS 375.48 / QM 6759 / NRRL 1006) TaxID=441959 RepID=B8MUG7_TALSN|nr:uncharacterized protein TSTA_110190 [Talaromyces stipitatus ATCC 10500]EED11839.1 hypothetical protein TSTA_110190 [Talaromyces stipitatus ATCC 10500]
MGVTTRRQARRQALGLPGNEVSSRNRTKTIEHLSRDSQMHDSESYFSYIPRESVAGHWLLKTDEFKSWERFLWIKGKPGAGKSTLMEHIARFTAYQMRDQATVTFCSVTEIYCVMLYQILRRNPEIDRSIKKIHNKRYLKSCLKTAITKMSRPLICFIDALDSCWSDELSELLDFCNNCSSSIKFCFSSRHYPYIAAYEGPTVILEEQQGHYDKIQSYLKNNLQDLERLVPEMRDSLIDEIVQKSSGCFLWIESLINLWEEKQISDFRIALDDVLPEMKQCLEDIVNRPEMKACFEGVVRGTYLEFLRCVQCVMHAKRPLNMEELFFAVLSGLPDRSNQPSTWTKPEVEKFVVTNSRGLVELDKSSGSIRFIHQTVPEILRQIFEENGITYDYFKAQEYMRQSCENYLSRPGSLTPYIKSSTLSGFIHAKFPFVRYALESHDHHSQAATSVKYQGHSTCDKMTDGQLLVAWYSGQTHLK